MRTRSDVGEKGHVVGEDGRVADERDRGAGVAQVGHGRAFRGGMHLAEQSVAAAFGRAAAVSPCSAIARRRNGSAAGGSPETVWSRAQHQAAGGDHPDQRRPSRALCLPSSSSVVPFSPYASRTATLPPPCSDS